MKPTKSKDLISTGEEWVSEIPKNWALKRIKYSSPLKTRKATNEDDLPYVGLENVESWTGRYVEATDAKPDAAANLFDDGDVLFGKLRPYLAKVLRPNFKGRCTGELLVLNPRNYDSRYLQYLLLSDNLINTVDASTFGAKMPRADWAFIGNLKAPLPNSHTQTRIADFLDQETARIDALIAKEERLLKLLDEKRTALISRAVTKGLDPNAELKDSGIEWIGQIPEGWDVKRLRYVAPFKNSNVDKKSYEGQEEILLCNYTDVYYNEVITRDIEFMKATASQSEIRKFKLKRGQVIITKDSEDPRDIGVPAYVSQDMDDVVCGYHLTVVEAHDSDLGRYIFRSLQGDLVKGHLFVTAPGVTRFGLSQDSIGDIPIVLPPSDSIRQIVDFLDEQSERFEELTKKVYEAIALLREKRTALISAAVTGKITI